MTKIFSSVLLFLALGSSTVSQPNSGGSYPVSMDSGWYWPTGSDFDHLNFCGYLGWLGYNSRLYPWHLAQDMCNGSKEGNPVYSIGDGEVLLSRTDVESYGPNYSKGGALVARYQAADGTWFTALYGHLNRPHGKGPVTAGEIIGYCNAWNPPHVHFAIHPGYSPEPNNPWRGYTSNRKETYGFTNPLPFLNAHPRTTPTPHCDTASFAPATNFAAGLDPYSIAVGDFNRDGKLDLAVANAGYSSVSILLGRGTGSFGAATSFTVGLSPTSVAVGDFSGDGNLDLAVANQPSASNGNVSILLGTGRGSFSAAATFAVDSGPQSLAVADFNGDGKLDLAVANQSSNNVSILLGTGTGSFSGATNFAAGSAPNSIAVGDLNSDGRLDLAVANLNSDNVSILLGTGTGSFSAATNFAAGTMPFFVAQGDFNDDGKLDLAVAILGKVSILLGTGTGSFGGATNFVVGDGPSSIAVGDFNGDGNLDLATANSYPNSVSILQGTGTGRFNAAANFPAGSHPQSLAAGDCNGDAKLDLVVANLNSDNVSMLLNNGPICPTPTPAPTPVSGSGAIVFSSKRDGNQEGYLLELDTGRQTNLTKKPA